MQTKVGIAIRYRFYMEDSEYLKQKYKKKFSIKLNLDNPITFNEKNNWRKLYDRNPIYTDMVDKFKLKSLVKERCGDGYVIPLLGVWEHPNDIDFDNLPNKFVLKCNHAGGIIVCRDKESFDRKSSSKELKRILHTDYFIMSREWPYKNVQRKIIAEQYMGDNLTDYKIYCFNGQPRYTLVWKNVSREDGRKPQPYFCGAFDLNWVKTDMELDYPALQECITEKPDCFETMIELSKKLSKGIPFVRVDFYVIDKHPFIGEMTFFPWGGFQKFKDERWNIELGNAIQLPLEKD